MVNQVEIHRLVQSKDAEERKRAVEELKNNYSILKDKKQAWGDLHRLTKDKDDSVRSSAAVAFGSCYSHIPDTYKEQTWNDLYRLTKEKNSDLWITANHSLGRISLYRTGQAKSNESIRNELETALGFFDKASNESIYLDPEKFCPPFYNSFYTMSFRKEEAKADVKKYLAEAKSALEDSASKKDLLGIVENLGNALNELHRARDSNEIRSDFPEDTRLFDEIEEIQYEDNIVKPYNPERSSIIGSKTKHCQLCLSKIDIDDKKCVFCGYEPDKKPDFWTISVLIFGIVMVMFTLVMLFGRRYADYEYWPILDNIFLIVVFVLFGFLIIYAIYVVVIAIESLRN